MTSSQPVVTPNALNFTNDNKFAYAYSGEFPASTTKTTRLEFTTKSETIIGHWYFSGNYDVTAPNNDEGGAATVYFNDQLVSASKFYQGSGNGIAGIPLIIPPFTTVRIDSDANDNQAARVGTISVTGKVIGRKEIDYQ